MYTKIAMLEIAFEDLKRLADTSNSGYCASHPKFRVPGISGSVTSRFFFLSFYSVTVIHVQ